MAGASKTDQQKQGEQAEDKSKTNRRVYHWLKVIFFAGSAIELRDSNSLMIHRRPRLANLDRRLLL
ncbi:hypothetical protein OU5_1313 [Pseudomonas mandelii JR-1]|uniref:Uncharacterized protein n=1 Tax=Pseudomonas mandelii JR-1 TaxID=1147786 RepID=A0A024E6G3_9PSED|nr:hypothetical protein OU5_1313 [Pseudomonas mandelii JR-1]OOL34544.1 hypothetical protein BOO94_27965 [Pseudomonas sp. FSL W5-0299]OYQ24229.1 hypothetical protein B7L09_06200 [Pseudomonas mandelii]